MLSLWADNTCERVRDEGGSGRWSRCRSRSAASPRLSPQVLRLFQVRCATGPWGPILPPGWQPGLWTGLAQASQEYGGRCDGHYAARPQRQSGAATKKPRLRAWKPRPRTASQAQAVRGLRSLFLDGAPKRLVNASIYVCYHYQIWNGRIRETLLLTNRCPSGYDKVHGPWPGFPRTQTHGSPAHL